MTIDLYKARVSVEIFASCRPIPETCPKITATGYLFFHGLPYPATCIFWKNAFAQTISQGISKMNQARWEERKDPLPEKQIETKLQVIVSVYPAESGVKTGRFDFASVYYAIPLLKDTFNFEEMIKLFVRGASKDVFLIPQSPDIGEILAKQQIKGE